MLIVKVVFLAVFFAKNTTLIIINQFDKNHTMVSMTTTIPILVGFLGGIAKGNALPVSPRMDNFKRIVVSPA